MKFIVADPSFFFPILLLGIGIGVIIGMVVLGLCAARQYNKGCEDQLATDNDALVEYRDEIDRIKKQLARASSCPLTPDILLHAIRSAQDEAEAR